jgi:hypothetical protein
MLVGAAVILLRMGEMASKPHPGANPADTLLAPSAALAPVQLPVKLPAVRQPYEAHSADAEVTELNKLHPEAHAPAASSRRGLENSATTETSLVTPGTASSVIAPVTPPLPVVGEPGTKLATEKFALMVPVGAVAEPGMSAADPNTQGARPINLGKSESTASTRIPPPTKLPVEPQHTVPSEGSNSAPIGSHLVAADLSQADQVQVLELVTQIGALVRDLRVQLNQLRVDDTRGLAAMNARLGNFERRLTLTEAHEAVTVARDIPDAPATAAPAPQIASESVASVFASLPATRTRTVMPPAPPPEGIKRYRLQAASPGLAMLAEIDRSGGEGAQVQVEVGDDLAGYGRVRAISQRGTSWVVTTDRASIQ